MLINDNRYPITIITGFLGSGKTTLLSKILKDIKYENTAVIINEYGEAGLDHRIIRRIEENTRLLNGGCICCNMRDDLINELKDLLNINESQNINMERVVIETTGLADPAPILFSILMDPLLTNRFYVDSVICCLDAVNGELHINNHPESVKQIISADKILITKTDIANDELIDNLNLRLETLNPAAQIYNIANGCIDPDIIFENNDVALSNKTNKKILRQQLDANTESHDSKICSMSVEFYEPLDWTAFGVWMSMLLYSHGEEIMRIKGIIDVGDDGPVVINGVQHIIHPPHHLESWNDEKQCSQIVFIMKNILPEQIMTSLKAFQNILGSSPTITEVHIV